MNDKWRTNAEMMKKITKLKVQKKAAKERMKRLEVKLSETIKRW